MKAIRLPFLVTLLAWVAASLPAAALAGGGTPPDSSGVLPYVNEVFTLPSPACSGPPISLVLRGEFPDACGQVIDAQVFDPGHVSLTLKVGALPDTACPLVFTPWRADFDLGVLPVGAHVTEIALVVISVDSITGGLRRDFYNRSHTFMVQDSCDTIPPPLPGLPYVYRIAIGRDEVCVLNEACPGDSIPVLIEGAFPNDCFTLRGIELVPVPVPAFGPPPPPIVRLIVDDGGCLLRICTNEPVPWSARTKLPPMHTPGPYKLEVQLAQVTCSDTFPPGTLYRTQVPFRLLESCAPLAPCLTAGFLPGPGAVCNATIAPGRPAELRFTVAPTVALAGLQGEIRLQPAALAIQHIEPIGVARTMLVSWTRTPEGARFVLFSTVGAPIPSWPPPNMDPRGGGWPVLQITVGQVNGQEIPQQTYVFDENLLGSDINGQAVLRCPPPPCVDIGPRDPALRVPAVICSESTCDFNADGFEDVRDLVLMVNCINQPRACPWDAGRFDCDGDSTLGIPDVICCARHMLQRPSCPACEPDSGAVRPEPRVSVAFGTPEASGDEIALPVRIGGTELLGAAMLTLEAPLDRYEVTGFDVSPPGNWLTLKDVAEGRLVLGMIDVRGGNEPAVLDNARFTLRLRLRPGQPPGGIVTATAGQFSGPDGVALDVPMGQPSQALPGGVSSVLGPNQPNPFSRETAFSLEVPQAGDVSVVIYDLRGRVVTTVHRGALAAGPHVFRWDGRARDGSNAPNGVYFYQATVGGRSIARKLILMRDE